MTSTRRISLLFLGSMAVGIAWAGYMGLHKVSAASGGRAAVKARDKMAINESGEWWIGSEPSDIEPYLVAYTQSEQDYPATAVVSVQCRCGSDRFRLVRALDITQRTCATCNDVRYICRDSDPGGWDEAIGEDEPDAYRCVDCQGEEANVAVGFAGYPENPEVGDAVKWFYVGVRCAECGILGCFNDGKVGRGPAKQVYQEVIGNTGD